MTIDRTDGLLIGSRVRYAVTSGFCTQVYHGKIVDFLAVAGNSDAFVKFDYGGADWIEAKYLEREGCHEGDEFTIDKGCDGYNTGDPVIVTHKGKEYDGTVASVQFNDGFIRTIIDGYVNRMRFDQVRRK